MELGECGGGSNLYRSGAKVFTPMRFSLGRSSASGRVNPEDPRVGATKVKVELLKFKVELQYL